MSYRGSVSRPFFTAKLEGNQSTNISVNNHIQFNTSFGIGDIASLSTGTGQSLGLITLNPGYIYRVMIFVHANLGAFSSEVSAVVREDPSDIIITTLDGVIFKPLSVVSGVTTAGPDATASPNVIGFVDCRVNSLIFKVDLLSIISGSMGFWVTGSGVVVLPMV